VGQPEASLVTIERPLVAGKPRVRRAARFDVPRGNPGGLAAPTITGAEPFPLT
jgi:hypothetical protein